MAKAATTAAKAAKTAPTPAVVGPALKMIEVSAGNTKNALAALEAGKGVMHMIAPAKLRVIPGFNVRVHDTKSYMEEVAELRDSIINEGFLPSKPITGYVGKDGEEDVIFVTDGHRRLEAARMAIEAGTEVTSVPVVLRDPKTSMVDLTVALVRENTGRRLSMLENAIVVKRLITAGIDKKDISKRLAFTDRYIDDLVTLIKAPKSIRTAVREEKLSGTEAVRILNKKEHKADPKKAEAIVAEMLAKAAAKGKNAASRKDGADPRGPETSDQPKIRLAKSTVEWRCDKGQEFKLEEIRHIKALFGDTEWFEVDADRAGIAKALEYVEFKAVIKRPKKEEAPPAKEEPDAAQAEIEAETEGEEGEGEEASDI